jgi:hypothetical protein
MSGRLFEIGQAVTLKQKVDWAQVYGNEPTKYWPKFGEIYHVKLYVEWEGFTLIVLEELYHFDSFQQEMFVPVISDNALEKALAEVEEEVMV